MLCDPQKVIDVALSQVGYMEKETEEHLNDMTANAGDENFTKYARDLDALGFYNGKKQSVAWCDVFYDWCMVRSYGLEAALALTCQPFGRRNYGAGCSHSREYYQKNSRLFAEPQPGDQVFFYAPDGGRVCHTGLVVEVSREEIVTVEGNTSGESGVVANGGCVCRKSYARKDARLAGFGRPRWDMEINV